MSATDMVELAPGLFGMPIDVLRMSVNNPGQSPELHILFGGSDDWAIVAFETREAALACARQIMTLANLADKGIDVAQAMVERLLMSDEATN